MKNRKVREDFIPDGPVAIGDIEESEEIEESKGLENTGRSGDPYESNEVEIFSSLFNYAKDIMTNSDFELISAIEPYRGPTMVYRDDNSIIALADEDGALGVDYYGFEVEAQWEPVKEQLYQKENGYIPGVENDMHATLSGDEAFDEISRMLGIEK